MAVITDEQRANLLNNSRFQQLAKMAIQNFADFIVANNGDSTPGGMPRVEWAKQRYIGYGVIQNPNSQDYSTWYSQIIAKMKGQDLWDTDENTTLDGMVTNNKFAEYAELVYALRSQNIEF